MLENKYRSAKRQRILIFLCWLVYTIAYLGRYSYNSNIKIIGDFFGQGSSNTGLVTTMFFFAYGAGQIINGLFCKKYNKKYMLSLSLILSAIINGVIGLGVDFAFFKYLWLLNGIVQSVLWSSLIMVLSENLDQEHLRSAIVVMSTCVPAGTFLAYGASALFSIFTSYRASFLLATVSMAIVGVVWFVLYSKNTIKVEKVLTDSVTTNETKTKPSASLVIMIALICVFAVICNLVKDGLQTWTPDVLAKEHALPDSLSIMLTLMLPLVGVMGASLAVQMQKRLRNYVLVIGIFFFSAGILLLGVVLLMQTSWVPVIIFMSVAFCMSQGINNIITSVAPLELRDKINSGMLTGVLNGFCYVGSTISGYGLGSLVENSGGDWNVVFYLLIGLCGLAVLITIINSIVSAYKKRSLRS